MLTKADSYEALCRNFAWDIPEFYNIGVDVCDKWADAEPQRTALILAWEDGTAEKISFHDLKVHSNRIANLLRAGGIMPGDRVGVLLPQALETAASHIAIYKSGAIAVPLFVLFGPEALEHRIADAGIGLIITNHQGAEKLRAIAAPVQRDLMIYSVDDADPVLNTRDFHTDLATMSDRFEPVCTRAEDPALIIYTSGTTGAPKGALHAHRVLLGHLPGMEMSHDFFPRPGDVIWTPADWAWIGGLLDILLPALHHGVAVVARRFEKFTAEAAYDLLSRYQVTNAFLPPTALKIMRAAAHDAVRHPLALRTVGSGGESLGAELLEWGRKTLGVTINEFYGQTECNLIVSSCAALTPPRPGIMGRKVPGHRLAVLHRDGSSCATGEPGLIAVRRPDPVLFLEYWNNPEATAQKFIGDWMITGDTGVDEGDGWLRFVGRDDDVINSAGYRIGPGEIEDCLMGHAAVRMAAIVGKPDRERTEIIKAYIVLQDGFEPTDQLRADIQNHVRDRLAAHEYPREISFLEDLPVTTTGKIMRRVLRNLAVQEG